MNAQEIIERIRTAEKKTPVKVYLTEKAPSTFPTPPFSPAGRRSSSLGTGRTSSPS